MSSVTHVECVKEMSEGQEQKIGTEVGQEQEVRHRSGTRHKGDNQLKHQITEN